MSAARQIAKGGLLLLPGLMLLLLALEVATASLLALRERNNPYVRALEQGAVWPDPGAESPLRADSKPTNDARLPVPSLAEEHAAHALFLLNETEGARESYASQYSRIIRVDSGGGEHTCTPAGQPLPDVDIEAPLAAATPRRPAMTPWPDASLRVAPLELGQGYLGASAVEIARAEHPSARVLIVDLPHEEAPQNSPYLRPFLSFKPHGQPPVGKVFFGVLEFRLNNFGFRDEDIETPRPPEVFRVACIGASTTMEGPDNDFTYPQLVERFLRERFPGRRIEVVNCGVSGTNTMGERARFADYLMLEPNAVVFYEGVNDICHMHLAMWAHGASAWSAMLFQSALARTLLAGAFDPDDDAMRQTFAEKGHANLLAMARYARQCGVTPYIATFAHPDAGSLTEDERVYYARDARLNWTGRLFSLDTYLRAIQLWNAGLREACAAEQIALIEVADRMKGGGRIFGDICHMKDYGIEQKARIVAEGLEPEVRAFFGAEQ